MPSEKQRKKLPVQNVDFLGGTLNEQLIQRHGELLPNSIRCLLSGPSGCGKTNAMLSLIYDKNGLRFKNLYVYSKSLYQSKYRTLEKVLKNVKGVNYYSFNENTGIVSPSEAQPNSVFIFDDIACDNQAIIREYFTMGRHMNIDSFYLGQTYTRVPKQLIRDNCNMLVIFKQDDLNLSHIYKNHVSADMTFEKFKELASYAWNKSTHGFLTICKDFNINAGRYRYLFDEYIRIDPSK